MWTLWRSHRKPVRPARRRSCRPALEVLEGRLAPATFTVTNTIDSGAGSLRQAILDANATPGADLINFNIPAPGLQTILVLSGPLPNLTDAVTIDGSTQPGFTGANLIDVSGTGRLGNFNGFTVTANGCTLRNLDIGDFPTHGILLLSAGNTVQGCFIGIHPGGTTSSPDGFDGVAVLGANNLIGGPTAAAGNIISGNGRFGVDLVTATATGNVVEGNLIGLKASGSFALGNAAGGVYLSGASGNTVGGTSAAARNVISGNKSHGVLLQGAGTVNNLIEGNYIGLNAAGSAAVGNTYDGVAVLSAGGGNVVGGTAPGAGNIISGNGRFGVDLLGAGTAGNAVQDNFIGTNPAGGAALPNGGAGVTVLFGPASNTVFGNLVSGNSGLGVLLAGTGTVGNVVQGNWVGPSSAGGTALANGGCGVEVAAGATGNLIGGSTPAQFNVISGNALDGVVLAGAGTTGNNVQGNFIGINAAGTAALGNGVNGMTVQDGAASDGIFGNIIGGNALNGVEVRGAGTSGHLLQGNLVGILPSSTAVANHEVGVVIRGGATGNRLVGNVVSGNAFFGVELSDAGTSGNVLAGNFVGLNLAGSAAVTNVEGVEIHNGASGNTVGGLTPADRNVISGTNIGVLIEGAGTNGNVVEGNFLGTNAAGTAAVPNSSEAVFISTGAANNVIGGTTAAARNLISGNTSRGVRLTGTSTTNNTVQGNFIGTNAAGTAALANGEQGVRIDNGATGNTIAGNVISGNATQGVLLTNSGTAGNVLQGNQIGTTAGGVALGNGSHGVFVTNQAATNTISGNVIANNAGNGVLIGSDPGAGFSTAAGTGNSILGNLIFANARLGIDLGANDGVTSNDLLDGDSGPNNLQNFPVLTSAFSAGGVTIILGSLNTTPRLSVRIEFFASPTADPSGHGQALAFLGFITVVTDGAGNAAFDAVLPTPVTPGQVVTATATTSLGDTSEFSADVVVT
jgi:titin